MIAGLDHLVLTVASIERSCAFYVDVLGMRRVDDDDRPTALVFGTQKINLHQRDRTFDPKAAHPTEGAGDFCLIASAPLAIVQARLEASGVEIELGPTPRTGAGGPMTSLYVRDPDQNLVEISAYPA